MTKSTGSENLRRAIGEHMERVERKGKQMTDPKYLYKFRSFRDENHMRILTHNEMFFPSPDKFNDPFDCCIPVSYQNFTRNEFIRYWTDSYKEDSPAISDHVARERAKNFYKMCRTPEARKVISENQKKIMREVRSNEVGVFSLTANLNSILSWSHYADSHRGFCIGFYTGNLKVFLEKSGLPLELGAVNYTKEYPFINAYKTSMVEKTKRVLQTKSIDWEYENEYRILRIYGANKSLKIPNGIIRRVILGCQVNPKDKIEMIRILKSRAGRISLFQAKQKEDSFGLRFELVRYGTKPKEDARRKVRET